MIEAIIPVRAGSRRLKGKNTALFGGTSLLANKIRQLKRSNKIDSILVSSDSTMMLEIAEGEGARTHLRSPEYADDVLGKGLSETIGHIASQSEAETLVWAQATSPLVDERIFDEAVELYFRGLESGYDSLVTQTKLSEFLWDEKGPLNYKPGSTHVPSQSLSGLSKMTFGVLIASRLNMIEWAYYHGPNPFRMMLGKREASDIDDLLDLTAARAWLDLSHDLASEIVPFDSNSETQD